MEIRRKSTVKTSWLVSLDAMDGALRVCPIWSGCQLEVISSSFGMSQTVHLSYEARTDHWQMGSYTLTTHCKYSAFSWGVFGAKIDCSPGTCTNQLLLLAILSPSYHKEFSYGIIFWNHVREPSYNHHYKQPGELLLEVLQQLETTLEFI
jgi:hypothetical protein